MKTTPSTRDPIRRLIKIFSRLILWLAVVLLVAWNLRFYAKPGITRDINATPPYAEAQLKWLRSELDQGGGERMQLLFPEGWFFCHVLHGLSWIELAIRNPEFTPKALEQARWAMARIESPAGKAPFSAALAPDHGMFYSAWRNHLLSGILLIQPSGKRDRDEMLLFEERCRELAETLRKSASPFPPSYPSQAWACDTPPAIHSLKVRDAMIDPPIYQPLISEWLTAAKERIDSQTGLLPHTVDSLTGAPNSGARATSQTIILRFLRDIDSEWGNDQYGKFRQQFYTSRLGVPGIREYPPSVNNPGDIDSGPLVWDLSVSATVVGMGVASIYGDHKFAKAVSQTGEALGFPISQNERRYLGGSLPVGDAFLVHATTARPWLSNPQQEINQTEIPTYWRWGVHGISITILALMWGFARILRHLFSMNPNTRQDQQPEHS